ncbi:MAG: hypothetical protein LBJ57_07850, partial [Prevotellaceae bacterium]|nr:hypothetical protein [Prevotellaceae bacterium]
GVELLRSSGRERERERELHADPVLRTGLSMLKSYGLFQATKRQQKLLKCFYRKTMIFILFRKKIWRLQNYDINLQPLILHEVMNFCAKNTFWWWRSQLFKS